MSYLFSKRKLALNEKPSAQALPANTEPGFEIIPKPEAYSLAAYLLSLNSEAPLFSAPFPVTKTNAPAKTAAGRARVVEGSRGAKLKVSFFGPFFADYWVLDRDPDYRWAIVGEQSGRYLWLLSREANPGEARVLGLINRAGALGYDTAMLRRTQQP